MEDLILLFKDVNFTNMAWQVLAPLIFSVADILTGFIQAVINHDVDSQKMRNGLWHKALLLIIILLGFVTGFAFNLMFIPRSISIFIIVMEIVSITENLKKGGINLGWLGSILKVKDETGIKNINYQQTMDVLYGVMKAKEKDEEDDKHE